MIGNETAKAVMSEEQMVHIVRNALLAAGQEMGDGDQWPVIKDTVYKIMKDYEDLKIERNVDAELKKHYAEAIDNIEKNLELCPADLRAEAEKMIEDLRELYAARFEPVGKVGLDFEALPIHAKRMISIVKTLEDGNE